MVLAEQHANLMVELIQQNTQLTEFTKLLSQRIEVLTQEMHDKLLQKNVKH